MRGFSTYSTLQRLGVKFNLPPNTNWPSNSTLNVRIFHINNGILNTTTTDLYIDLTEDGYEVEQRSSTEQDNYRGFSSVRAALAAGAIPPHTNYPVVSTPGQRDRWELVELGVGDAK